MKQQSLVKCWAKSTQTKITSFFDQYLINYPVKSVRISTQNLLFSLFKKGTSEQKDNMLELIRQRILKLNSMGKSSQQFLQLIKNIFSGQLKDNIVAKRQISKMIIQKVKEISKQVIRDPHYNFYSFCANTIDFKDHFNPYLLQKNGCTKCYGKVQFEYQTKNAKDLIQTVNAHINQIQVVLKKIYSIKNLKISFGKKKFNYRTVSIFYLDQKGQKKQVGGKYAPLDPIPQFQMTTKSIIFQFDFQKAKRHHIVCTSCSNGNVDEYSFICSVCFNRNVDIDGQFKVVGADPQALSDQLCESYKKLSQKKSQLFNFYSGMSHKKSSSFPNQKIVQEMEQIYNNVIKNLQLLKKSPQGKKYKQITDCFSCNIFEIENTIKFLQYFFKIQQNKIFQQNQTNQILLNFKNLLKQNKIQNLKRQIYQIIATLIFFKEQTQYKAEFQSISLEDISEIICQLILVVKARQQMTNSQTSTFKYKELVSFVTQSNIINQLSIEEKMKIFVCLGLKSQFIDLLNQKKLSKDSLNDLVRLDIKQFKELSPLCNFNIQDITKGQISTISKLFLSLIPESYIPSSNLQIKNSQYLDYVNIVCPQIDESILQSNVIYSPEPIIKLNMFGIMPHLIKKLTLNDGMKIITNLCKYKNIWNLNLKQTLKNFQEILQQQENQKKLRLSLIGYQFSHQDMYLQKIYNILVPQRMKFLIRMQVPEADMKKQQVSREGGPIQYIYLPIRQVKSQDLNGDTMRALHEWVTQQLKKLNQDMPFDLIVDKFIIDNLDLPIEVVYKKIAQKQAKKYIGNNTYDFLKVIYRMQGFFGDANESASSNPRDDNLETCLQYSSHLLTKISILDKTGIDVIMSILQELRKSVDQKKKKMIFKILQIVCMNPAIIKKIVQWQYGDLIINMTIRFFSLEKSKIKFSQVLLQMCSKIIDEANEEMTNLRKNSYTGQRKQSQIMDIQQIEGVSESEKAVKYLIERVKECQDKLRKDLAQKLIKLIPFCSKDEYGTSRYLFEFFEMNKISQLKSNKKTSWLLQFIDTLSQSYTSFKTVCRQNKFTDEVINLILQNISVFDNLEDKKQIKNLDLLQLGLTVLKGLIRGDQVLQNILFQQKVVHSIYKISKLSESQLQKQNIKTGKVLTLAFQIVKYFKQGKIVCHQITEFIKHEQGQKLSKNAQKKKSKLQMMKQKNNKIAQKYQQQFPQDDESFVCSSCREGYMKRNQILGIYLYSSKSQILSLQGWWKQTKRQNSITSVSYFTPIHYQCHMKAFEADQKIQKTQWDGALIRNSDVKCNNWIGIKGPKTTDDQFDRVQKKYFDKNNRIGGFWVVLNDLNGLIEKFATQYDFSQQTKGSSAIHNCKLILVLMAFSAHLMKKSQQLKFLDQGVKYLEEHLTKRGHLMNIFFCISLFTNKYDDFQKKKELYLKMITNLQLNEFSQQKKYFTYLAIIKQIFCLIHVTLKEDKKVINYLDSFIAQNFNTLVLAFEKIAQKYKNIFTKWQSKDKVFEYFSN